MIVRYEFSRGVSRLALFALVLVVCTGCNVNGPQSTAEELGQDLNTQGFGRQFPAAPNNEFTFGPGDTLILNVADTPEFSAPHVVRADGRITIPLINDVTAAGLTTTQLAQKLKTLIALYVNDPQVTVSVGAVVSKAFFVGVQDPQQGALRLRKIPYRGDVVLMDVMTGIPMGQFNDATAVKIIRGDPRRPVIYTINAKRMVMYGETGGNLQVRPDDIILVPPSILGHLNIWLTGLTAPFQGLFRVTSTAVRLDRQIDILTGDVQYQRGRYGGGYGYTP
ncbi:MAG: polysaccharide biosynthesis/export family protein [Planctomycetota bacterium]|nr:polysaccharide biosynthesis/export family protein [Planctomycetota bacterium]